VSERRVSEPAGDAAVVRPWRRQNAAAVPPRRRDAAAAARDHVRRPKRGAARLPGPGALWVASPTPPIDRSRGEAGRGGMPPCGRGVILQDLQGNTPGESASAGRKHNRGNGIRRVCPVQRSARYHAQRVIIKTVEIQVRRRK